MNNLTGSGRNRQVESILLSFLLALLFILTDGEKLAPSAGRHSKQASSGRNRQVGSSNSGIQMNFIIMGVVERHLSGTTRERKKNRLWSLYTV